MAELHARRKTADIGWLKKTAKEMDILIDDKSDLSEDDLYDSDDEVGQAKRSIERRELKQLKNTLKHLLEKPIFPKGFSYKYPSSIQIDSNTPDTIKAAMRNNSDETIKNNALDVMKSAIEDNKLVRRKQKIKA